MHAVVVMVQVNDYDEARKALIDSVVARVSERPGFVTGVWLAPDDGGRGSSIVVWETADQAQVMADFVREMPPNEITVTDVSIREVIARA